MALRNVVVEGDEILRKKCREVGEITDRIKLTLDDMLETMHKTNDGIGLAAPQVGVLKRIVVIDTTGEDLYVLINPQILETSGEQTGQEGCLSVPGKCGTVERPEKVWVEYQDRNGKLISNKKFTGFEAKCFCHEFDHLNGILYIGRSTPF